MNELVKRIDHTYSNNLSLDNWIMDNFHRYFNQSIHYSFVLTFVDIYIYIYMSYYETYIRT